MKSKLMRLFMLVTVVVMLASSLGACAPAAPAAPAATAAPAAGEKVKIGLSFSDFATERWKPEADKSDRSHVVL